MSIEPWIADRQADIEAMYVAHDRFVSFVEAVETRFFRQPPRNGRKSLLFTGASGSGKSTVVAKVLEMHPRVPNGMVTTRPDGQQTFADHVPALLVTIPAKPSYATLAIEILRAFAENPDLNPRGNYQSLGRQIDAAVRACGTQVIVLDDAQRLVDSNRLLAAWDAAECIKDRMETTGVGFALFGLGRVHHVLDQDKQFKRRFDNPRRFEPFPWSTHEADERWEDYSKWVNVLGAFQRVCPMPFAPELVVTPSSPDAELTDEQVWAAGRFHYATRGWPGYVKPLLQSAVEIMFEQDAQGSPVDLPLLAEAYERSFDMRAGTVNPFTAAWRGEPPPVLDEDDDETLKVHITRKRRQTKAEREREVRARLSKR